MGPAPLIVRPTGPVEDRPDRVPLPRRGHRLRRIVGAGVIVAAGALSLSACGGGGSPAAGGGASSSTGATTHQTVTIKNFSFHPANFTVEPGARITVKNDDSVTHTFTADDGKFNTGDIGPGTSKTVTAPKSSGEYPYMCQIHQFMTGTLTVK